MLVGRRSTRSLLGIPSKISQDFCQDFKKSKSRLKSQVLSQVWTRNSRPMSRPISKKLLKVLIIVFNIVSRLDSRLGINIGTGLGTGLVTQDLIWTCLQTTVLIFHLWAAWQILWFSKIKIALGPKMPKFGRFEIVKVDGQKGFKWAVQKYFEPHV